VVAGTSFGEAMIPMLMWITERLLKAIDNWAAQIFEAFP